MDNTYVFILLGIIFFMVLNISFTREKMSEEYVYEFFSNPEVESKPNSTVGLITFMRKPIDLSLWFKHHRLLGVTQFFIRVEDTPELEDYLQNQKDVVFEMGDSNKDGDNYMTLFERQITFINSTLKKAQNMNIDWVFNVDVDELLHGNLRILDTIDPIYKCLKLENAEAVFRENEPTCFSAIKFLRCGKSAPCRAYANGKSAARAVDGVESRGVHNFAYNGQMEGPNIYNVPFEDLHILHFDACSLGSWVEKYYHLSKNSKKNIPFPYYYQSIDASVKAYDVYKKHTMDYGDNVDESLLYYRKDK
jgi:hypothetical protein